MDAINICKWRTVEFSVKIKVQDFLHVFDMISFFFLPQKIGNNFLMGSYYWKKNLTYLSIESFLELLIHFIVYIIIRCLLNRVFASQNPRNVCKMEKEATEEKVTKQTYWTFLFCFFVKFNACVVFMDTRVFNYKYRNIKQTSYGNRHFQSCHSLYNCGHTFLPTSCSLFANTPHGTTPIVTSFRLNCLDRPSPKAALTCLVTPRSTYQ